MQDTLAKQETKSNNFATQIAALSEEPNIEHLKTAKKIVPLDEVSHTLTSLRQGKRVVHCHGVFDLMHIGHIKHLQSAKSYGDILVVTITPDRFVNKGPGRPHFTEHLRAEALASLSCVDFVVINQHPTAVEPIQIIEPDFYVKGIEYQNAEDDVTGKISEEEATVHSVNGQLIFTKDIVFSSSSLLNRYFSPFSPEVVRYVDAFKEKFHINDILHYFEGCKKLKVLLIGEAIIDVYHYSEAIGKSGKEPVLATKSHREEIYIGGVLAIANHLSDFCAEITCLTSLGEKGEYEAFIRKNLKQNVNIEFQYKKDSPTIVKKRYVEEYSGQKMFEIYEIDDCYFNESQRHEFNDTIKKHIADYDVVIVADYGHGLLAPDAIETIERKAKFLAINTQANASNHGFNCVSKYKKADYVCIANRELQLNYRQKHISTDEQIEQLMNEFDYKHVVVTSGLRGSFSCKQDEPIYVTPALATSVKDRVGAGDAVLSVTSLFVAQGAPAEMVGFVGNVVGSQAVNIMGNKSFIEKIPLVKHIVHLLK